MITFSYVKVSFHWVVFGVAKKSIKYLKNVLCLKG
jgi:hypothetical protein